MSYNLGEIFPAGTAWAAQEAKEILSYLGKTQPASLNKSPIALPVIDPRDWQGKTAPERKWFSRRAPRERRDWRHLLS